MTEVEMDPELAALVADEKVEIPVGGHTLRLLPLSFKDIGIVTKLMNSESDEDRLTTLVEIIDDILQRSYPGQNVRIKFEYLPELMVGFFKANGMEVEGADFQALTPKVQVKSKSKDSTTSSEKKK